MQHGTIGQSPMIEFGSSSVLRDPWDRVENGFKQADSNAAPDAPVLPERRSDPRKRAVNRPVALEQPTTQSASRLSHSPTRFGDAP